MRAGRVLAVERACASGAAVAVLGCATLQPVRALTGAPRRVAALKLQWHGVGKAPRVYA